MVKNLPANAGDLRDAGSIPGLGRPAGEGNGTAPQYSCLKNSMSRGAWWVTVQRATKSWTRLSTRTSENTSCLYLCTLLPFFKTWFLIYSLLAIVKLLFEEHK